MEEVKQTQFSGWALVEIMGHRRAAGEVTTEYIGTAAFLRVVTPEVPPTRHEITEDAWVGGHRLYSGSVIELKRERAEILVGSSSIYAITPIKESDVLIHAPLETVVIVRADRQAIMGPAESQDDSDRREPRSCFPDEDDDVAF